MRGTLIALFSLPLFALPARAQTDSTSPHDHGKPHPVRATLEVLATNVAIQRFNWWLRRADWADVGPSDWARNIRLGWEWDVDEFQTNMFGHPWGGGYYFNAGRDNGLGFWGSVPLTFLGSVTWEYFGENLRPSLNDLYMTAFGGVLFGEVGHRLAAIVRDNRTRGLGRVGREIAAIPFDPVGSVNRVIRGEWLKVGDDADSHDRHSFGLDLQGGVRLAVDSGPNHPRAWAGTLLADISYGDAFAGAYRQPFDVFRVRLQVSPWKGGINIGRIRGRLWGRELTDSASAMRHIVTVAAKSEYLAGPAYKFGGQSLESGLVSDFQLTPHTHLQTEGYVEWLLLGGLDAPGSGVRERTYDFGPGGGASAAATLVVSGQPLVSARYRFAFVHTVSGSKADHQTDFLSLEAATPRVGHWGLGGYAGWYRQKSVYAAGAGRTLSFPEFRVYLMWHGSRGPTPREATGANGL